MEEEQRKKANVFLTVKRAMKLLWESKKLKIWVFNSVFILLGAVTSVTAVLNKNFLNSAADVLVGKAGAFSAALFWLSIWAVIEIADKVLQLILNRATGRMWTEMESFVKRRILDKVGRIRFSYFDDREEQKKIRNVKGHFASKVSNVTSGVVTILRDSVTLVTVLAVILSENWLIALLIFITAIPSILISKKHTDQQYWMSQGQSFDEQMQRYLGLVITKRKYVKEMRFYQLYHYMEDKYDKSVTAMLKQKMKLAKGYLFASLSSGLLLHAAIAASLVLISVDIFNGKANIGSFMLIYSTAGSLQSVLQSIFSRLDDIGDNGRFLEDYENVMRYEEENYAGADEEETAQDRSTPLEIVFKHVSFTYPGSEREILKDINLTIRQGEKIAVVGENGSGKSTFVSLLAGLYMPTKGEILVNGKKMQDMLGYVRNKISCTTQEFFHLEGTVEDNVRIGDFEHAHNEEEIREALKKADLLEEVDKLEQKEKTYLGNLVEGGTDLSGGQWQKLAMARNLIKTGAQLMIMDEPTAALDPNAETKLYQNFAELTEDKSVLLISHRLGAARLTDRVLVFHDGSIVEDGSHDSLLSKNGLYTKMYNAQSQWYV